jgi:hypothetical protein
LVDGTDVCAPTLWRPHRELIAFSETGCTRREWELPSDWRDVARADLYEVEPAGLRPAGTVDLPGARLSLPLEAGRMVSVVPAGTPIESLQAMGATSQKGEGK